MPSKSIAQQHLMQAAEHGAQFPAAQKLRQSMSHDQLHDFSVGSEAGKPEHVGGMSDPPPPAPQSLMGGQQPTPSFAPQATSLIHGDSPAIMGSNTNSLKQAGQSEFDATRNAIGLATQAQAPKKPRHTNLGNFLHPRKDGKPHGSDKF